MGVEGERDHIRCWCSNVGFAPLCGTTFKLCVCPTGRVKVCKAAQGTVNKAVQSCSSEAGANSLVPALCTNWSCGCLQRRQL
jgi:hypothetical protein